MKYYTMPELAKELGLSVNTVKAWRTCNKKLKPLFMVIRNGQYPQLVVPDYNLDLFKAILKERNNDRHYWSIAAIECYKRGMVCEGCRNKEFCDNAIQYNYDGNNDTKPPMKKIVLELIKTHGIPRKDQLEEYDTTITY